MEYLKEYRKKNWQRTKARNVWKGMLARCYDKKQGKHCKPGIPKYADYGARGVRVCEAWEDFEAFWNDMGPPPTKLATLDRCNPERNYTPRNCRWVDGEIQSRNRRTTRWITAVDPECGERLILCVTQWSQRMGIARTTIHSRLKRGWNPSRAVTELVQKHTLDDTVPF